MFSTLPGVDVDLCYFHLKQSAHRHIQELGLQIAYNDAQDPRGREFCHMLAGLAYVQVRDIKSTFLALQKVTPIVGRMPECVEYFGRTYVVNVPGAGKRSRVPPLFEPALWNIYQATLEGRAATNNASEGWHNRFATMLEGIHPDLWKLIDAVKREQGHTEIPILEMRIGRKIKAARKKKWADYYTRIQTVVQNYQAQNVMEYLKTLAYHISFN